MSQGLPRFQRTLTPGCQTIPTKITGEALYGSVLWRYIFRRTLVVRRGLVREGEGWAREWRVITASWWCLSSIRCFLRPEPADRMPGFRCQLYSLHLEKLAKEKTSPREGPREGQPAGPDQSRKRVLRFQVRREQWQARVFQALKSG